MALVVLTPASALRTTPDGRSIRLGGTPLQLVATRDSLWVLTCDRRCSGEGRTSVGRVVRVDARTGRVVSSVAIDRPGAIAVGARDVYATDFWRDAVRRIDAHTLRVTRRLKLTLPFFITTTTYRSNAFLPEAVAVGSGSVWIATDRGALAQADPRLRKVVTMLRLPGATFQGMVAGNDTVWLSESLLGVYRVNATANRVVARIRIGPSSGRFVAVGLYAARDRLLAVGGWTSGGAFTNRNGLALVDAARNRVQSVTALPPGQLTSAYGAGALWVARVGGSSVERIDPHTGRVIDEFDAGIGMMLAAAGGHLWTAFRDGTVQRLSTP